MAGTGAGQPHPESPFARTRHAIARAAVALRCVMAGAAVQQPGMRSGGGGDLNVDYYVPDFRIEVEGKQLSPSTHGDIIDLKVNLGADELGGFDFTLNNWDDEHLRFKYSDSAELMIGNMVRIELGYVNRTRQVIHGP